MKRRVIFPPPNYFTPEEASVIAINRPLTDEERHLVNLLAIASVAHQTGVDERAAAEALDTFTETGEVVLHVDAENVYLEVAGKVLVHCERAWLAFHAEHPEAIDLARHAHRIPEVDR
jgi:hypothetical protein